MEGFPSVCANKAFHILHRDSVGRSFKTTFTWNMERGSVAVEITGVVVLVRRGDVYLAGDFKKLVCIMYIGFEGFYFAVVPVVPRH